MKLRSLPRLIGATIVGAVLIAGTALAQVPRVGDKAPAFALPATTGGTIRLADFAGRKSLVLFTFIGAFTNA